MVVFSPGRPHPWASILRDEEWPDNFSRQTAPRSTLKGNGKDAFRSPVIERRSIVDDEMSNDSPGSVIESSQLQVSNIINTKGVNPSPSTSRSYVTSPEIFDSSDKLDDEEDNGVKHEKRQNLTDRITENLRSLRESLENQNWDPLFVELIYRHVEDNYVLQRKNFMIEWFDRQDIYVLFRIFCFSNIPYILNWFNELEEIIPLIYTLNSVPFLKFNNSLTAEFILGTAAGSENSTEYTVTNHYVSLVLYRKNLNEKFYAAVYVNSNGCPFIPTNYATVLQNEGISTIYSSSTKTQRDGHNCSIYATTATNVTSKCFVKNELILNEKFTISLFAPKDHTVLDNIRLFGRTSLINVNEWYNIEFDESFKQLQDILSDQNNLQDVEFKKYHIEESIHYYESLEKRSFAKNPVRTKLDKQIIPMDVVPTAEKRQLVEKVIPEDEPITKLPRQVK